MFSLGEERKKYFKKYDASTDKFIEDGVVTIEVANFLYQSDCEGKINRRQAKQIYELIKECNDDLIFGYAGKVDCTKMSDFKNIFSDGTKVEWR